MKRLFPFIFVVLVLVAGCHDDTNADQSVLLNNGQSVEVVFSRLQGPSLTGPYYYRIEVDAPGTLEVVTPDNPSGISVEILNSGRSSLEWAVLNVDTIAYGPVEVGTYYLKIDDELSSNTEQTFTMRYRLIP